MQTVQARCRWLTVGSVFLNHALLRLAPLLQALQHQSAPLWNNKLVSAKPKLQPVPESGPCNGGPLNLMPLPHAMTTPDVLGDNHLIPGLDDAMDEFADFDSEVPEGLHKHLPSTGSLAQQLQMTHVGSNHNLAALEQQSQQQQAAGFSSSALQVRIDARLHADTQQVCAHTEVRLQLLSATSVLALNQCTLRRQPGRGIACWCTDRKVTAAMWHMWLCRAR